MLKRRVLTSVVSVGFQRRDSWTDCLCSNTLLCRTLLSLSQYTLTHTHTHTVCLSPPQPILLLLFAYPHPVHPFKGLSPPFSLFPACLVYCLPVFPLSSPPSVSPFFYLLSSSPFPLSRLYLSISLLFPPLSCSLLTPLHTLFFLSCSLLPFSPTRTTLPLILPSPSFLVIGNRCLSSCSLNRKEAEERPRWPCCTIHPSVGIVG